MEILYAIRVNLSGTFEFAGSFVEKNVANGHLPDCAVRLFALPTNQMSNAEFDEHVEKSDFGLGPAETERATGRKVA